MKEHGPIFSVQLGPEHPMLCFSEPKSIEFLLTNTSILDKMTSYSFLNRWLGRGLLIAGGKYASSQLLLKSPYWYFRQRMEETQEDHHTSLPFQNTGEFCGSFQFSWKHPIGKA